MTRFTSLHFALALLAISSTANAVDLLDIYRTAQSNDPVFASARASLQAGQEKLSQGRSLLMPSITLKASSTFNDVDAQYENQIFPSGTSRYHSNGVGVTLIQPLFRQQSWQVYSQSQLQVVQSEAQFKIAEQELILRVAQAYFDVLIAKDSVLLVEAQKKAISEQLEQAKRNFEVGSATITDTLEAQARYDLTGAQELAARNSLEIKRRSLQQLINKIPQDLKSLGNEFKPESLQPADMEKWVEDAHANNLELVIARLSAELAEKEVTRNLGGHYPTLDLVANYSKSSSNGGSLSGNTNKSIGVQLNMPLYLGGLVNSRWREAEANLERASQELENVRRSVATQARQAYLGVESGMAQVQALKQALASSKSVLEASKLGQQVGVRTNLDVLNAQQQLFSTRQELFQAQYNYLMSRLRLKASVGTLNEADLNKVNQALQK